jgi:hypothetical protein
MSFSAILQSVIAGILVRLIWDLVFDSEFRNQLLKHFSIDALGDNLKHTFEYFYFGFVALLVISVPLIIIEQIGRLFNKSFKFTPPSPTDLMVNNFGINGDVARLISILIVIGLGAVISKIGLGAVISKWLRSPNHNNGKPKE